MKIAVETKQAAAKDAEVKSQMKTAGFIECFILGIGITGGGIATSRWQFILIGGMWEGLISLLVGMMGYYMLLFSLSELVGIVPFAGGSFGFVRCSLGPFWGFMAACSEMVMYMFYSTRTFQKLAQLVTVVAMTNPDYEPIWALCAFISVGICHLRGGRLFWNTMIGCTLFTFMLLLVFMIGSYTDADFNKYALDNGANNGFIDKVGETYMAMCHYPVWFFMGLCTMPLTSQRVKNVQVTVPKAMMWAMTTMSVIAIISLFCVACQPPIVGPKLNKVRYVLGPALSKMFGITLRRVVLLLMVPTYASAIGFMFACKHQLGSMAESGLAPAIFKTRFGPNKTPVYALLFTLIFQFSLYLVINKYLINNMPVTFLLCCTAACLIYIAVLTAYIAFKYKFEGMQRQFVSPVGIPGAVLGICVFSYILIGVLFYHPEGNHAGPIAFFMFMAMMVIYYFSYVQYVQFFSLEEQEKFMKAYILNANKKRKASKWVKMMNTMFVSTGLDKLFLRSTAHKGKTMTKGSKSRSTDDESPADVPPVPSSPTAVGSLKNNKVGILVVDVALYGDLCSASADTVCTPTLAASRTSTSAKRNSGGLTWSGKQFGSDGESRKAFQLLHATAESNDEDTDTMQGSADGNDLGSGGVLEEQLIEAFPEHFVLPSAPASAASIDTHDDCVTGGSRSGRSNVLLRNLPQLKTRLPTSVDEADVEMGPVVSKDDEAARPAETTSA